MKATVKSLALRGLTAPPVYRLLQMRAWRGAPVTILCYHTLRPDDQPLDAWVALQISAFQAQIAMLRQSYDIVSLDAALTPAPSGSRPRVVLTFDDGETAMLAHLLPIVQALDIPVTVYIATGHIETGQPFWFDRVMNALQGAGLVTINLPSVGTWQVGPAGGPARWAQIGDILEALKQVPTTERDRLADQIVAQAGPMASGFDPLHPMTPDAIKTLAAEPRVTIGAHSHGHELLDQLSLADATTSIARSRDLLASWTRRKIRHFAYPNGNYSPALMGVLDDLGFASATILEDRLVTSDAPAQALPRIGIGRYETMARFKLRLVGI